jgi:hypothetical protein
MNTKFLKQNPNSEGGNWVTETGKRRKKQKQGDSSRCL